MRKKNDPTTKVNDTTKKVKINKKALRARKENPEVEKNPAEGPAVKYLTDLKNSMVEKLAQVEKAGLEKKTRLVTEVYHEYLEKMGNLMSVYNPKKVGRIEAVELLKAEVRKIYEEHVQNVKPTLERKLEVRREKQKQEEEEQFKKLEEEMNAPVDEEIEFGPFESYETNSARLIKEQIEQDEAMALEEQTKEVAAAMIEGIAKQIQIQEDEILAGKEQAKEIATTLVEVVAKEVQKNEAIVKRVDRILDSLVGKIERIGNTHSEARTQAVALYNTLMVARDTLEDDLKADPMNRQNAVDKYLSKSYKVFFTVVR